MNPLDFHILLALAQRPLHGYAIAEAVASESEGSVTPRAGSLYRVISRLESDGLLTETEVAGAVPHPGRERRYYQLTRSGRAMLGAEVNRLKSSVALARKRLGALRTIT